MCVGAMLLAAVLTSTSAGEESLVCTTSTTWSLIKRRVALSDIRYAEAKVEIERVEILRDQWRSHAREAEIALETCSARAAELNEQLLLARYHTGECVQELQVCQAKSMSGLELGLGAGGVCAGCALISLGVCGLSGR